MSFSWSFSRLDAWRLCPRRFAALHIERSVVEPPSPASDVGLRVHAAIAARLTDGAEWPDECKAFAADVDRICAVLRERGELFVEHRVAVTRSMQPCDWDADEAWLRAIFDLLCVGDDTAVLVDWKTGRQKAVPSDQLKISSVLAFELFPHVDIISASYVWLTTKPVRATVSTYRRSEARLLWEGVITDVEQMQRGIEGNCFPPRPSPFCRRWCAVTSCEFNGRRNDPRG